MLPNPYFRVLSIPKIPSSASLAQRPNMIFGKDRLSFRLTRPAAVPARIFQVRRVGLNDHPHTPSHETHRLPLLRPLDPVAAVADAVGGRRAAAIDRARRRGRGAGRGRGLFPRASLRPPARLAVPAAGGVRREDEAHRDRHRGHRHALREPAVHGGGRGRRRPHRRRAAAARHQPRLARAGDRRLALLRLRPAGGHDRRRHGAAPHRGLSRRAARRGLRQAQPAADVPEPARPAARSSRIRRACASASGGAPAPTPRRNGRPSSA